MAVVTGCGEFYVRILTKSKIVWLLLASECGIAAAGSEGVVLRVN
jgi:hypothetical protein